MAGGGISAPEAQAYSGSPISYGGPARTYFQQRPDVAAAYERSPKTMSANEFAQQHYQDWGRFEGNVNDPSKQFFQPVYQPRYQNYAYTNPMGISQYGQQVGGFDPYMMQTPFNPYSGGFDYGMQTPFSMMPNYGPTQPIVTRSAGMRGTPNVMMRRAEGGIASLMDNE